VIIRRAPKKRRVLLVDGYNVLNALPGGIGRGPLADAREALFDRLQDYAGFSGQEIILVFDAWMSDRMMRSEEERGPVKMVFTQKGETADHFIERFCDDVSDDVSRGWMELRVATSDGMEQILVMGRGATRISARELLREMESVRTQGRDQAKSSVSRKNALIDRLPEDVRRQLEDMRRQK